MALTAIACGTTNLEGEPDVSDTTILDTIPTDPTDTASDDTHAPDVPDADDPTPEEPTAPCEEEIAAIAAELGGSDSWSCTAVVRLDYLTYELIGYQFICGEHTTVTEEDAHWAVYADTCLDWEYDEVLHEPDPDDVFVFIEYPSDMGCVGVVSADTGLTVFGASIVWMGTGWIMHPDPDEWQEPAGLGSGCPWTSEIPIASAFDLVSEDEWTDDMVDEAADVVRDTALPAAFERAGSVYHAVVLRYPRSVGEFVPERAEWIVLVNGGVPM
jgi:hypothetical protein